MQVLWPMGTSDAVVLRVVPDRVSILNSREKTPFFLFIETLQLRPTATCSCGGAATQQSIAPTVPECVVAKHLGDPASTNRAYFSGDQVVSSDSAAAELNMKVRQGEAEAFDVGLDAALDCSHEEQLHAPAAVNSDRGDAGLPACLELAQGVLGVEGTNDHI